MHNVRINLQALHLLTEQPSIELVFHHAMILSIFDFYQLLLSSQNQHTPPYIATKIKKYLTQIKKLLCKFNNVNFRTLQNITLTLDSSITCKILVL